MAKPKTLKAELRARTGSGLLKRMRREGYAPSVVYGGGVENKNIKIDAKTLRDMLSNAASDSILVNLDIEGEKTQLAFLQDLQHDHLSGEILHVDFLAVDANTEILAPLPLELIGESKGVKAGGVLEQMIYNMEIRCLPNDLPEILEADISGLEIGDMLHISDVAFPEGATPTLADDVVVALVAKARVAEEEDDEAAEEGDAAAEPEVTSEKPAADEGE